jgi:acyl dehydratase
VTALRPFVTAPIDAVRIRMYADAMQDPNPVHRDRAFARSVGLPDVIAPGGMAVVALSHLVARWTGREAIDEVDVRLRAPIRAGVRLTCTGEVDEDADGDGRTVVRCAATDDDGTVCAEGTVWVRR